MSREMSYNIILRKEAHLQEVEPLIQSPFKEENIGNNLR